MCCYSFYLCILHFQSRQTKVFAFKIGGTWTPDFQVHFFFSNWYFLISQFLTYTSVGSSGTFLTLNAELIFSGNWPVSLIHQFQLNRSWALPDCVPRLWWKMAYLWICRVHPQSRGLLIPHLIAHVRLHCTIWPGGSPVAAALVPFCLYAVPFPKPSGPYLWI